MWWRKSTEQKVFVLQTDEYSEPVQDTRAEEDFFEEAFADYPTSAGESNRLFVGSIISSRRYRVFAVFLICVLSLFIGKTGFLQLVSGAEYRAQAEQNRLRVHVIPAQRGIIYDRQGTILAHNEPVFNIITSRNQLPADEHERQAVIQNFADNYHFDASELMQIINETDQKQETILLVEDIAYEEAIRFFTEQQNYYGLDIEQTSRRSYLTDEIPSLSHLIGYTGSLSPEEYEEFAVDGYRRFDYIGKQGLERSYELLMRGSYGEEKFEVDALGNTERIVSKTDAVDGENLYLTVDAELQAQIEKILQARLEGTEAARASVIVMDPSDGAILSMVSWPAYDANAFTRGIDEETYAALLADENLPLFPRAYAGEFPSGSTIKPVYAAAALMEGIIDDQTAFLSTGGLRVGVWFFPDWRAGGHGLTDVYHAIADSVNTFFYIIGGGYESFTGLGVAKLMDYAALFGFGAPTGLDVPGEASGFLPSKEWKLDAKGEIWYIGDTYHVAIGQGDFLATPLQIAHSTAIFANHGRAITPHLVKGAGTEPEQLIPYDTAEIIRNAMRQTVTAGSARSLQAVVVPVAGKTGTAQWSSTKPNHSWFTGFAPFDDPEIVVTVLVEEGAEESLAVGVSHDVLDWWFAR